MNLESQSHRSAYRYRAEHLAEFARTFNATHALTLQPGYVNAPGLDPERYLSPLLGRLFELYARYGRGQSRQQYAERRDAPDGWFIPESFGKGHSFCPHAHGVIALREGEEPVLRGFLRRYFGLDQTSGPDTPSPEELAAVRPLFGDTSDRTPLAFEEVPANCGGDEWLLNSRNCHPSFDLKPIHRLEGWCAYTHKQYSQTSDTPLLPISYLLDHATSFKSWNGQSLPHRLH